MVQRRQIWNRNVGRGGKGKVRGRVKDNGKKTTHKNGRRVQNKLIKSRRGRGQRWGKRRSWRRRNGKGKRQGRTKTDRFIPPDLPYRFINTTWYKGYEICGPEECEDICKSEKGLVCVESTSSSAEECKGKHKCVWLCGERKSVDELQIHSASEAVICHQQEEKCSEDNKKCERIAVDKEKVLAGMEGVADNLAQLINETETNLDSLMKRGQYTGLPNVVF